jgi:hypothetical protein
MIPLIPHPMPRSLYPGHHRRGGTPLPFLGYATAPSASRRGGSPSLGRRHSRRRGGEPSLGGLPEAPVPYELETRGYNEWMLDMWKSNRTTTTVRASTAATIATDLIVLAVMSQRYRFSAAGGPAPPVLPKLGPPQRGPRGAAVADRPRSPLAAAARRGTIPSPSIVNPTLVPGATGRISVLEASEVAGRGRPVWARTARWMAVHILHRDSDNRGRGRAISSRSPGYVGSCRLRAPIRAPKIGLVKPNPVASRRLDAFCCANGSLRGRRRHVGDNPVLFFSHDGACPAFSQPRMGLQKGARTRLPSERARREIADHQPDSTPRPGHPSGGLGFRFAPPGSKGIGWNGGCTDATPPIARRMVERNRDAAAVVGWWLPGHQAGVLPAPAMEVTARSARVESRGLQPGVSDHPVMPHRTPRSLSPSPISAGEWHSLLA